MDGARVNHQRADGTTPLCAAAAGAPSAGRVECARRLLESGADPSITRASGAGPFYLAAAVESSDGRSANPAMVKLLSEHTRRGPGRSQIASEYI